METKEVEQSFLPQTEKSFFKKDNKKVKNLVNKDHPNDPWQRQIFLQHNCKESITQSVFLGLGK